MELILDKNEGHLRKSLCEAGHRLYNAGFMAGSDGNLSVLLNQDKVLITPSRLCKGYLEPEQIIKVDRSGKKLSGDLPPSVELSMHLAAYEERPDISAVVHCHPPILVAFTVARKKMPSMVLPEIEVMFGGEIPMAPYATPGTSDLGDSIRQLIRRKETVVLLLDHHGVLAVSTDIFQAAIKAEHAEAAAKVIFYALQLGGTYPLPEGSLEGIRKTQAQLRVLENQVFSAGGQTTPAGEQSIISPSANSGSISTDADVDAIVRKVVDQLMGKKI
jgi:L-fuculose-phosphate aldolase